MILGLYAFLIGISITLILLGVFRRNESAFALVGFALFFILSLVMLNGNLEVEKGANTTTAFNYDAGGNIVSSTNDIDYSYETWEDTASHQIGFWLATASALGFIFMLYSIQGGKNNDE